MSVVFPLPRRAAREVAGGVAGALDDVVTAVVRWSARRMGTRSERLAHAERLAVLAQIEAAYADAARDAGESFFAEPPPIQPLPTSPRRRAYGIDCAYDVVDVAWATPLAPSLPDLRERYGRTVHNATAHARFFLGRNGPRPAVILIHGYLGGHYRFEERAWPIRRLLRLGLDVALAVLPFHALRGDPARRGPPPFPSADPRLTNEGFRHAVHDLRALARYLRACGAPSVGIMGMSLGGYTASLLATIDPEFSFVVPVVPLASVSDFARDQGRLGGAAEAAAQHAALTRAHRVVDPLARAPRIPPERILVVAAAADRITPPTHAERLAAHFGAPLLRIPGGHLLQFGRGEAWREVERLIRRLGIVEDDRPH